LIVGAKVLFFLICGEKVIFALCFFSGNIPEMPCGQWFSAVSIAPKLRQNTKKHVFFEQNYIYIIYTSNIIPYNSIHSRHGNTIH